MEKDYIMREEHLWVERYRPHLIKDCILTPELQNTFEQIINEGEIPNLLALGPPGVGKTTVLMALCEQLEVDFIFIPASMEGNIDTLRNKIAQFASSMSFTGKRKYIILDEADFLSYATQPALRNFMEQYSSNCGFLLSANYKNKILPALQSRCSTIEFNFSKSETAKLAARFFNRILEILEKEQITFDKKAVAAYVQNYVKKNSLDFRKILNELQRYAVGGTIDSGILVNSKVESFNELLGYMKDKDFTKTRLWISTNLNNDTQTILRQFYDESVDYFAPQFIPELTLIIAQSSYESNFIIDQEICIAAFCVKCMMEAVWR